MTGSHVDFERADDDIDDDGGFGADGFASPDEEEGGGDSSEEEAMYQPTIIQNAKPTQPKKSTKNAQKSHKDKTSPGKNVFG
jgi:hypothetical protein